MFIVNVKIDDWGWLPRDLPSPFPPSKPDGEIALGALAQRPASPALRLPGLPQRSAEKAIGRVADASSHLVLPAPAARRAPPDDVSTVMPLDAWTARRRRALAALEVGFPDRASPDWSAARGLILSADPFITLPIIEEALAYPKSPRLRTALQSLSTSIPGNVQGLRWDARCGAPLAAECATTRVVAVDQTTTFRFGDPGEYDAPATLHYIHVDDQTFPVFSPAGEAPKGAMTIETLAAALSMLPKDVLQNIGVLTREYRVPESEARTTLGFTSRRDHVISLIAPGEEMNTPEKVAGVLLHEVGHRLAFALLGAEVAGPGWNEWQKAHASDAGYISEYSKKTWHEDFAETYAAWRAALGTPFEAAVRARFQHKFAILDRIIGASAGAPFKPEDPKHYTYKVRVTSAQFANTGDWNGPGQVYYQINGGKRSDVVTAAGGERMTYSDASQNVRVVDGARLVIKNKQASLPVKVEFYDSDVTFDDYLGDVQANVRIDPRGEPQHLELKTKSGDTVTLEISAWPSRRPTRP